MTLSGAAPDPFLMANGIHLRNGRGTGDIVPLRGVNLGGWLVMEGWQCPMDASGLADHFSVLQTLDSRFGVEVEQGLLRTYQSAWMQARDFDNIQSLGMNVIRVPVWWATFEDLSGHWRADAFDRLDWAVTNAWQRGIYTLIDLHGVPGGQSTSDSTGQGGLNQFWASAAHRDHTAAIWTAIASHYVGNPAVAGYDLINEPSGAPSTSAVWSAYNSLYKAIRAVDPDHVIFMEGTFGNWNWSMLPNPATYKWTNIVYEMHEYQWNSTTSPAGVKAGIDNQIKDFKQHQSWKVPACIGEFNCFGTGSDTWKYAIQQFNSNGMSWTMWSYKATHGSPPDSWGVYDPAGAGPAKPRIQTDTAAVISNRWSTWGGGNVFSLNSMLKPAIAGPLAVPDRYRTLPGTTLTIATGTGLLFNDRDLNRGQTGIKLQAQPVDAPAHGQLSLESDGSFSYMPDPAFTGIDTFRYAVFDGFTRSANIAEVTVQVAPSITPPLLRYAVAGGQIQLSWPADHLGWILQAQTVPRGQGLGTNWFDIADSSATNQVTLPVNGIGGSVFLRLLYNP
ncbi:MAG TPA: cellulase family glycosylhydrolase [Candidatus Limnocylindria bacterium]|nr:cellulase family glycosylhydrolase [Candidatus Limnocylindria bacterium]